ncbi:MAG: MFS transporter [Candidatus Bathyarchaeia archaeon]
MEDSYIPIQVRSGAKRGSEEGTEVIVKHKYIEEVRRKENYPKYIALASLLFLVVIIALGPFIGPFIASYITETWRYAFVALALLAVLVFWVSLPFAAQPKVKVIKEERERHIAIFFPNIFVADVNNVKEIYRGYMPDIDEWESYFGEPRAISIRTDTVESRYGNEYKADYENLWGNSDWPNIFGIGSEGSGEVWAVGWDVDNNVFSAKFYDPDLYSRVKLKREELLQQAYMRHFKRLKPHLEYLEKVGRYEEAARIYEELGMPEKAGEMRRKKREVVVLDLNALIRQLGERGFTITYHCSHCGAPVRISGETTAEAIQYCSHCGSRIETIDVANFIKKYLS